MFQIYHSNSLLLLKDLLCELIRRDPLNDPFASEQILVQSPGMAQWLKLELAESDGIAAAIDFPLPASFLWKSFSSVLDGVPERSAYNKEAMSWKLMSILPELLAEESFSALRTYLQNDEDHYRLYQLCQKIADIFDQYLVYRPDWIEDWEQGGNLAAGRHAWQPILWRALQAYSDSLQQSHWHRANMFGAFIQALSNSKPKGELPKRLFVFGISALPENYLQALKALGQHVDVHLMVTNPCQYYWGDILDAKQIARINRRWFSKEGMSEQQCSSGNPLLASLGKLGRDYIYQLQDMGAAEIDAFADPEGDQLLQRLQKDILNLEDRSVFPDDPSSSLHKQLLEPQDHSIQFHSCHSPLREVEVLHDQLLAIFEENPDLRPRDIIVMMPDVAAYAPYIEAVFSNVPTERYIPFAISDRSDRQENPLLQSVEKILRISWSRFTVSDVLELLEVPAIMRRYKLSNQDFQKIRRWVDAVNIRWGLNAEQRSIWDLPLFEQNSWRFGLRRMLLGYALGDVSTWQGVAPYPEIEGLSAEPLGILVDFIDLLEESSKAFSGECLLNEWIERVNTLLERLYEADEQDEYSLELIRRNLQKLKEQLQDACYEQPLSIRVFADYLLDGVNNQRSSQRFMVGAVNFCTLMPMRSIPFQVVCLLGMNDGAYPRTIPPLGFDLMNDYPRKGDRSRRDDDRYLFLEALLSAQKQLYISFIGRSVRDNNERIPSVLVSELQDYIEQSYVLSGDENLPHTQSADRLKSALQIQHLLTAFSADYFTGKKESLFSFASEWVNAAEDVKNETSLFVTEPLVAENIDTLELNDLIRFLRRPSQYFFNQRLKVYFLNKEVEAQDEEPFTLDSLEGYLLKQRYLNAAIDQDDLTVVDQQVIAEGVLPIATPGLQALEKIRHDCIELAEKLQPLQEGEAVRQEVLLDLDGVVLSGWLDDCYPQHMLRYRPATIKGNDYLYCWVEHLALCAMEHTCRKTAFRGLSGLLTYAPVTPEKAHQLLCQLVGFYQQGQAQPQALDANAALAYQKQLDKDPDQVQGKIEQHYFGGFNAPGLAEDPYIRRAFPSFEQFQEAFVPAVEQVFAPMFDYVEEHKGD